eukprot:3949955-Prymnesium_polylepis.1
MLPRSAAPAVPERPTRASPIVCAHALALALRHAALERREADERHRKLVVKRVQCDAWQQL